MKKLLILAAVLLLASCSSREKQIKKETEGPHKVEVRIQGHLYYMPTVGHVSGQSAGFVNQLVHDPDCKRCDVIRDSVLRAIIREELQVLANKAE